MSGTDQMPGLREWIATFDSAGLVRPDALQALRSRLLQAGRLLQL